MERVDDIDRQIAALYVRYEADLGNVDISKAMGALFVQKKDYPSAISWHENAFMVGGCVDCSLESIVNDLKLKLGGKSESN